MKSFKIISIFALTLLLVTEVISTAEAGTNIKIVNNTGKDFISFKMSFNNDNGFVKILEDNVIFRNNATLPIELPANTNFICIQAIFQDGGNNSWGRFYVSEGKNIVLK